ncbi:prephenate dehydratase [Variovorax paradoxus]|uniref:prephenate dehydratase n=1 Tax=Variovorax paradoxus TaxID=34073 RepID=UPI00215FE867|nr:prephenate dehydratase [Variovorax paradoxus]UVH60660.1 prephenate dehydratase [Variovorax paradoxus]
MKAPYEVACLGPAGTYSEDAAIGYFGAAAKRLLVPSLDEVFAAVEATQSVYGVVAVENSTEGSVARTLDLLAATELKVCGELTLGIHHALMSSAKELVDIHCVRAHAQALAQCLGWLSQNVPHARREAVSSNAEGARMASLDPASAAIASERSALQYGVPVLFADIQDIETNQTRFLILGGEDQGWSDDARTLMIISVANEPGALYKALEPFHRHAISMSRLESRPSRRGVWEYNFYIELVGHRTDPSIAAALSELEKIATVRMLGSFAARAVS